jgi:peptidoglycan hydrolase-like protein with peptidoglycan-binding domain
MLFALAAAAQPASTTGTATTAKSDETAKTPTVFRPSKAQIKQGQSILKEKKIYDGEATGVYNDGTRAAIKSFQKSNGIEVNGKFDKATLEKLNIPLTESQGGAATASTASSSSTASKTGKRPPHFGPTRTR